MQISLTPVQHHRRRRPHRGLLGPVRIGCCAVKSVVRISNEFGFMFSFCASQTRCRQTSEMLKLMATCVRAPNLAPLSVWICERLNMNKESTFTEILICLLAQAVQLGSDARACTQNVWQNIFSETKTKPKTGINLNRASCVCRVWLKRNQQKYKIRFGFPRPGPLLHAIIVSFRSIHGIDWIFFFLRFTFVCSISSTHHFKCITLRGGGRHKCYSGEFVRHTEPRHVFIASTIHRHCGPLQCCRAVLMVHSLRCQSEFDQQ